MPHTTVHGEKQGLQRNISTIKGLTLTFADCHGEGYLIVLNFRGTYFRGRRFRKVSREFIFADDLF